MADVFLPRERSRIMALVKSTGNRSTEGRMRSLFKANKIKGWRTHPQNLPGRPDFIFSANKLAIFVHGCFWHGCLTCKRKSPSSNILYWTEKIRRNRARDKRVRGILSRNGWKTLTIWEHQIQKPLLVLKRIKMTIS
jgi:DNA mismatch endonuclease (patch repair protein)